MRILIAEDHHLVRAALSDLLRKHFRRAVLETATNGQEAIDKVSEFLPEIVILDYEMRSYNGIFAAKGIRKISPTMPILMLSMHDGRAEIIAALKAGINGYLTKESQAEELFSAIRKVARGSNWFKGKIGAIAAEFNSKTKSRRKSKRVADGLTPRELQVVQLIVRGYTNDEIAKELSISVRTAELHKWNIYQVMGVKKVSELILFAIKNKLVSPDAYNKNLLDRKS